MADQKLDQLDPTLTLKGLEKEGNEEPAPPGDASHKQRRLRDLVCEDWRAEDIRLIAWSEQDKMWYMWTSESQ
jgi:hypothetical protein